MPATNGRSKAQKMQDASVLAHDERRIRITIIDRKSFEYHLNPYESVVRGILDPETADAFIEVPIDPLLRNSVRHAYLHTTEVAKLYIHDDLTEVTEEKKTGG